MVTVNGAFANCVDGIWLQMKWSRKLLTVNKASELLVTPYRLLTVTEYSPALVNCTSFNVNTVFVAHVITFVPFQYH